MISAMQMHEAVQARVGDVDVFIGVAAVADYRPTLTQSQKIKKATHGKSTLTLELVENPDIIAEVAARKNKPFTVGFAAETEQLETFARKKLAQKNLDMIVANNVSNTDIGFNSDQNAITVYEQDDSLDLPMMSKRALSEKLIDRIAEHLRAKP